MKKILIGMSILASFALANTQYTACFYKYGVTEVAENFVKQKYDTLSGIERSDINLRAASIGSAQRLKSDGYPVVNILIKGGQSFAYDTQAVIANINNFFYYELSNNEEKKAFLAMVFKPYNTHYKKLKEGILTESELQALGIIENLSNQQITNTKTNKIDVGSRILEIFFNAVRKTKEGKGVSDPEYQNFLNSIAVHDFYTTKKVLMNSNYEEIFDSAEELCEKIVNKN